MDPPTTKKDDVVCMGDYIILLLNDEQFIFTQVHEKGTVKIAKASYPSTTFLGEKYGCYFQAESRGKLKKLNAKPEIRKDEELTATNRSLWDDNTAQKISKEEIDAMKDQGVSGEKIIQALVENSSSFNEKTSYSQEKYLKKKQKKHLPFVQLLRCSLSTIVRAYTVKDPAKIHHIRQDSLAQLLTYSNVQAGMKVIVADSTPGLVVGAALERVGADTDTTSKSSIISLYSGNVPSSSILKQFNFPSKALAAVSHVPLHTAVVSREPEIVERLKDSHCLIVATKHDPCEIVLPLTQYLVPSASFAIWSANSHALALAYQKLLYTGEFTKVQLSETWMREYQVLPGRTHPLMSMNGASGYVLSGIKILPAGRAAQIQSSSKANVSAAPASTSTVAVASSSEVGISPLPEAKRPKTESSS